MNVDPTIRAETAESKSEVTREEKRSGVSVERSKLNKLREPKLLNGATVRMDDAARVQEVTNKEESFETVKKVGPLS